MKSKTAMTLPVSQEALLMILGLPSSCRVTQVEYVGQKDVFHIHVVTENDEFIHSRLGRLRALYVNEAESYPHVISTHNLIAEGAY